MSQPPMELQVKFWNRWIDETRRRGIDGASARRRDEVLALIERLHLDRPKILEVGCANGWLCEILARYGTVTGTDLAVGAIQQAQARYPHVRFVAGDFVQLSLDTDFDLVVCVDTLASVADHVRFMRHISDRLKPRSYLILTSQNPYVFQRYSRLAPLAPGQVRHWASRSELRDLLSRYFDVLSIRTVNATIGDRGLIGVINSRWVNGPARLLIGQRNVDRLKESAHIGQTIVSLARKR